MKRALPFLTILLSILGSCGGNGGDIATPRRKAYPRIALADTVYTRIDSLGISMEINAEAVVKPDSARGASADGTRWFNIRYPRYGDATVFVTVTPSEGIRQAGVIDNRLERMALNTGGADSELTEFSTPQGFDCKLLVTRMGTVTPVQFIAHDSRRVVTGAFYLPAVASSAPDSIAPIIGAVAADLLRAMKTMN